MGYFRIARPSIVDESIDGEVIIVNLEKGLYFSADGVGGRIWDLIAAGTAVDDIRSRIGATYSSLDPAALDADLTAYLASLQDHALIAPVEQAPVAKSGASISTTDWPQTYAAPEVQVYSDMEQLLLLDPIHDVDETAGWPAVQEADSPPRP